MRFSWRLWLFYRGTAYAHQFWRESIETSHFRSTINLKTPLLILRELIGAGYPGAILVLAAAGAGLAKASSTVEMGFFGRSSLHLRCSSLWSQTEYLVISVAIRQMIFVLAPLAILCAGGLELLMAAGAYRPLFADVCWLRFSSTKTSNFSLGREKTGRLRRTSSRRKSSRDDARFSFPPIPTGYTNFLIRNASSRACPSDLTTARAVTVAVSPYESISAQRAFEARLSGLGFSRQILLDKMVRVELYQRK